MGKADSWAGDFLPGKGGLGSSQSHLHREEQLCSSMTGPRSPQHPAAPDGVFIGPFKVHLAQTPSDGKMGGWYGPQTPTAFPALREPQQNAKYLFVIHILPLI